MIYLINIEVAENLVCNFVNHTRNEKKLGKIGGGEHILLNNCISICLTPL